MLVGILGGEKLLFRIDFLYADVLLKVIDFLWNCFIHVLSFIVNHINFDGLLGITASLIALLIPVAILLLESNGNNSEGSFTWDKLVLFSQVLKIKSFVIGLFAIVIPLIFWTDDATSLIAVVANIVILIFYIYGVFEVFLLLRNSYYWIISKRSKDIDYRNSNRFAFIEDLKNENFTYQADIWDLIWSNVEQRAGMDEKTLLDLYFKQYSQLTKCSDKNIFLSIYFSNFKLDFNNIDKVQELLNKEFPTLIKSELTEDFDNNRFVFRGILEEIFLELTRQSLGNSSYQYYYKEWFNNFLKGLDDNQYKEFLSHIGTKFFAILHSYYKQYDYYDLSMFLPDELIFDEHSKNEKKSITLKTIYMNWLKRSYILIPEKDLKGKLFANRLLEFMFKQAEPIVFFRIIGFSMFIENSIYDQESLKNSIFKYATEPSIFIGIGRTKEVFSDDILEDVRSKSEEHQKWTYNFIKNLGGLGYYYLIDVNTLDMVIEVLEEVINDRNKDDIDDLGLTRLNGVYYVLLRYRQIF
ncbi:TPA: hypothetical protein ACHH7R_002745 [Enterococcus faecium]